MTEKRNEKSDAIVREAFGDELADRRKEALTKLETNVEKKRKEKKEEVGYVEEFGFIGKTGKIEIDEKSIDERNKKLVEKAKSIAEISGTGTIPAATVSAETPRTADGKRVLYAAKTEKEFLKDEIAALREETKKAISDKKRIFAEKYPKASSSSYKRIDSIGETVAALNGAGDTPEGIAEKSDRLYVENGGKTNSKEALFNVKKFLRGLLALGVAEVKSGLYYKK